MTPEILEGTPVRLTQEGLRGQVHRLQPPSAGRYTPTPSLGFVLLHASAGMDRLLPNATY